MEVNKATFATVCPLSLYCTPRVNDETFEHVRINRRRYKRVPH